MKLETVKEQDEKFRPGVKRTTFEKMIFILEESDRSKKKVVEGETINRAYKIGF